MTGMWGRGGLSVVELLKRTAKESWEDDVFAQAGSLAFYHFLAIFPVILLLLMLLTPLADVGKDMRHLLASSFDDFLPSSAAKLVSGAIADLDANAHAARGSLIFGTLVAVWAAINASWAMIVGLNTAYETKEDRGWREIALSAGALAVAVVVLVFAALLAMHTLRVTPGASAIYNLLAPLARWAAVVVILLISFALFYRFGPNLKRREWRWSTPGAVFAAILWIGLTVAFRAWCDRLGNYQQIYGRAAAAVALLLWIYLTSATVLIGAELNSEIEKASGRAGGSREPRPQRRKR